MVPPWFINGTLSRTLTKNVEKLKQHLAWEKKKHGLLGALKVKTQFEHRFRIVILIGRPTLGPFETPTSLFAIVAAAGSHLSAGRVGGSREVIFFLINVGGSNNCNCFRTASSTLD